MLDFVERRAWHYYKKQKFKSGPTEKEKKNWFSQHLGAFLFFICWQP